MCVCLTLSTYEETVRGEKILPWVCVDLIKWQNVFEVPTFDFCVFLFPRGALLGQSGP